MEACGALLDEDSTIQLHKQKPPDRDGWRSQKTDTAPAVLFKKDNASWKQKSLSKEMLD